MNQSFAWVPLLMIVACGVVLGAQATISNEDHPKLMKANAQAAGAMNKAIGWARSQTRGRRSRHCGRTSRRSRVLVQQEERRCGRNHQGRIDAARRAGQAPRRPNRRPDGGAGRCQRVRRQHLRPCRKQYREGDAQWGFRFKDGVL